MTWPSQVKENLLVKCGRRCCVCQKYCGTKIEIDHIIAESEGGPSGETLVGSGRSIVEKRAIERWRQRVDRLVADSEFIRLRQHADQWRNQVLIALRNLLVYSHSHTARLAELTAGLEDEMTDFRPFVQAAVDYLRETTDAVTEDDLR